MSQMLSSALPGTTSLGIISSSMTWRLELDALAARGVRRRRPSATRLVEVAFVVDADLGDDERKSPFGDGARADGELSHTRSSS